MTRHLTPSVMLAVSLLTCLACNSPTFEYGPPQPAPPAPPRIAFSVSGTVSDVTGVRLSQARLEITDGRFAGTVAFTDDQGAFTFAPTFDADFTVRVSKNGYVEQLRRALSTAPVLDVYLVQAPPSGSFRVTFEADSACTSLPEAARKRVYRAAAIPYYGFIGFSLDDATFLQAPAYGSFNILVGNIKNGSIELFFSDGPVIEELAPGRTLIIEGNATGRFSEDAINELDVWGYFEYCEAPNRDANGFPSCAVPPISCTSPHHRLTIVRQE